LSHFFISLLRYSNLIYAFLRNQNLNRSETIVEALAHLFIDYNFKCVVSNCICSQSNASKKNRNRIVNISIVLSNKIYLRKCDIILLTMLANLLCVKLSKQLDIIFNASVRACNVKNFVVMLYCLR